VDVNVTDNNDKDRDYIPDDIETLLGMDTNNSDQDGDGVVDGFQLDGDHGDAFFEKLWHIRSTGVNSSPYADSTTTEGKDLNLTDVYHSYMGYHSGVVQIVDTGVDADHEDLSQNMDLSLSRNSDTKTMGDPQETADSSHGTMCAGIIGARAFNGKGVRGVAPFVKLAGSNWLSYQSSSELEEVWTKNDPDKKIIIASNSWGTESASPATYYESLMAYAAANLRQVNGTAKGKLFIKAAGNGRGRGHDSGLSYASSNPYVITVAALKSDNTHASYSSPGANILVSGYSGDFFQNSATIGTTYIAGRAALREDLDYNATRHCYERSSDHACSMPTWAGDTSYNYTYGMNGTSAATPTVAGSLALVLEACPSLPWRDVKYLIAKHATQVDTGNASWFVNGAGLHYSVDYGFGLINVSGMISECKGSYTPLPASTTFTNSFDPDPDIAIPDNDAEGITYNFVIPESKTIEWVGLTLYSDHTYGGDLEIYLTSPTGTTVRLMKGANSGNGYSLASGFRYGSVAFLGEASSGTWTVKIADIATDDTGEFKQIDFLVMGH
jgi:subtilisin-like proprotein convertase family protein